VGVPAAGFAGDHGGDLAGVADEDELVGHSAECAEVGEGELVGLVDEQRVEVDGAVGGNPCRASDYVAGVVSC
jgi:hypothetical protein